MSLKRDWTLGMLGRASACSSALNHPISLPNVVMDGENEDSSEGEEERETKAN